MRPARASAILTECAQRGIGCQLVEAANWWFNRQKWWFEWDLPGQNGDWMGFTWQKWWLNGIYLAKMVIEWDLPGKSGDLNGIYLAKMVIEWDLPGKNGDWMGFTWPKWCLNGIYLAKMVI